MHYGDVSDDKLMRLVMAGFGERERDERYAYFEDVKRRAVESGIYLSKVPPFGYSKDTETKRLAPNEDAPTVVEIFKLRGAGGSWRQCVELFYDRTGKWRTASSVEHIIRNRAYRGEAWYQDLRNHDAHEPIVSEDEYAAANRRFQPDRPRAAGVKTLLAGIARCGTCDAGMGGTRASAGQMLYRCTNRIACSSGIVGV